MEMEMEKQCKIINKDDQNRKASLYIRCTPSCEIVFKMDNSERLYKGEDLFCCLTQLRKELETEGSLIACKGSQINVYPSGMCRQMASGMLAYTLSMGRSTSRKDIVNIFDIVDESSVILTTVNKQKEYYEQWLKSLKQKAK